ncbi:SAM-dependent methyltransferase [Vibrio mimicus VM223]|nr:SAM-dependent methyltransferase [Vibrio mimicus VM223]
MLSQLMSPLARDIVALDSSEAMIEELDRKELRNVEPVVDSLTRGLVAQHPAFRKQFDLVVASSVCAFLPNEQDVADIIFTLVDEGGYFIHFDWLADGKSEVGLSLVEMETVLKNAGFSSVDTQIAFDVTTEQGILPVMVGIARK